MTLLRIAGCALIVAELAGMFPAPMGASPPKPGEPHVADISEYKPDLVPPVMSGEPPGRGKRVRATLPAFGTDVYFALYLPPDWQPNHRFPVIVEYAGNGNYRSKYGDVCTGRVEDCSLGYGLSGGTGSIWLCLPYVDLVAHANALQWWGDIQATVAFCKQAVARVCSDYGGDAARVIICGFSRGALACNYIGLHDEEIGGLWRAFFAASHYDGARAWPYPQSDPASARARLARLRHRPVFISHELYGVDDTTYTIVDTVNYLAGTGLPLDNFTFQQIPLRNHTDRWVLCDLAARRNLRAWYQRVIAEPARGAASSP